MFIWCTVQNTSRPSHSVRAEGDFVSERDNATGCDICKAGTFSEEFRDAGIWMAIWCFTPGDLVLDLVDPLEIPGVTKRCVFGMDLA